MIIIYNNKYNRWNFDDKYIRWSNQLFNDTTKYLMNEQRINEYIFYFIKE